MGEKGLRGTFNMFYKIFSYFLTKEEGFSSVLWILTRIRSPGNKHSGCGSDMNWK
jgi:hypothetical protein